MNQTTEIYGHKLDVEYKVIDEFRGNIELISVKSLGGVIEISDMLSEKLKHKIMMQIRVLKIIIR